MKRTIEEWKNCEPNAMAYSMSNAAKMYAFEDAKADILEMHSENLRLRNIVRAIAYPQRGTPEEEAAEQWREELREEEHRQEDRGGY